MMIMLNFHPALASGTQDTVTTVKSFELEEPPKDDDNENAEAPKKGWHLSKEVSLGANVSSSENRIGQADGLSTIYNLKVDLDLTHFEKLSEWENTLKIDETLSRTPALPRFIQSTDDLRLGSAYKSFFSGRVKYGYFSSLALETNIFEGYDERAEPATYLIAKGESQNQEIANRLKLTDPFKPMTTTVAAGAIVRPYETKTDQFEAKTGPAAKSIVAAGQLSVVDDEATDQIEVTELEDAQIIGWLFGLALKGKSSDEKFTYKATAEALYPISYESELDNLPEKANLVDTDVSLKLSYNLNSWTAFSYDFRAKREPLIAPDVQISHMALLNITIKNDPKEKTTPVLTK